MESNGRRETPQCGVGAQPPRARVGARATPLTRSKQKNPCKGFFCLEFAWVGGVELEGAWGNKRSMFPH